MCDEMLAFNGVDVDTGDYLFPMTRLAALASEARADPMSGRHVEALDRRHADDEDHLGVMWGTDPEDLASAGWGLVTAKGCDPAVLEALQPLRSLRCTQAGERYRELVVNPGDDDDAFLTRHGMGPGPADPRKVPYYLLLVGDPDAIPYAFQYQLDVEYAVGRVHFDTVAEYGRYAWAVEAAEQASTAGAASPAVQLFGTRNRGDTATALSASRLRGAAGRRAGRALARRDRRAGPRAGRNTGAPDGPAVRRKCGSRPFTASHGLGGSGPDQRETRGALLCQEWPGPLRRTGRVDEAHYVAGCHVPTDRPVGPRVVFSFSCYGAGTPPPSPTSQSTRCSPSKVSWHACRSVFSAARPAVRSRSSVTATARLAARSCGTGSTRRSPRWRARCSPSCTAPGRPDQGGHPTRMPFRAAAGTWPGALSVGS